MNMAIRSNSVGPCATAAFFPSAGELAGDEELDAYAGLDVAKLLAAGKRGQILEAIEIGMRLPQSFVCHQYVDVDRRSIVPMSNQGHPPGHGMGDIQPLQFFCYPPKGLVDRIVSHEEPSRGQTRAG